MALMGSRSWLGQITPRGARSGLPRDSSTVEMRRTRWTARGGWGAEPATGLGAGTEAWPRRT